MATSRDQLLDIIQNGRQFLMALEKFAATNFPKNNDDDEAEATTTHAHFFQHGESGRFDDAEKSAEDENRLDKSDRSPPAAEGNTLPIDSTKNEISPHTDALAQTSANPPKLQRLQQTGAIAQFCAETGVVLAQFQSLNEAVESIAESMPNTKFATCKVGISDALLGRRRKTPTYKGFYFRFIGDDTTPMPSFPIVRQSKYASKVVRTDPMINAEEPGRKRKRKEQDVTKPGARKTKKSNRGVPVLQFCAKTGKHIGRFETVKAAAKSLASSTPGVKEGQFLAGISQIVSGRHKRPVYRGFYFRYSTNIMSPFPEFPIPESPAGWRATALGRLQIEEERRRTEESIGTAARHARKHEKNRAVLQFCATTGKELGKFDSQKHAATTLAESIPDTTKKTLGSAICSVLNGKKRIHMGWYFRYFDDTLSPMPTFPITSHSRSMSQARREDAPIANPETRQNGQSCEDLNNERGPVQAAVASIPSRQDNDSLEEASTISDEPRGNSTSRSASTQPLLKEMSSDCEQNAVSKDDASQPSDSGAEI